MLGAQNGETKGKRIVRRVISTDPTTVEVSFEDSGHLLGVSTTGMGTYTSVIRPDNSIYGEGQGINLTQDGEGISWTGTGLGKFGPDGALSYRGMLFFSKQFPEDFARLRLRSFRIRSRSRRQHNFQNLGVA
jgi:hypothetical protein